MALLERWEAALRAHDVESLTGTYADHATLDSPLVPHITGCTDGQLRGHSEIRPFIEAIVGRTPTMASFDPVLCSQTGSGWSANIRIKHLAVNNWTSLR